MDLEIAFAASARDWPDRVHRHLLDHGGARVVGRLMGAIQCVDTDFHVIFIDDVCSFLSPRLVALLRQKGRVVMGVYDSRDSPDAKRRLLECGISDVIESDATADEFLARAVSAAETVAAPGSGRHRASRGRAIGVLGVTDGVGATEIAVTLATRLAERVPTVLVDLDPAWPSIAQRLDLPPHPNLGALVDVVLHEGEIGRAMIPLGELQVVGGSPWQRSSNPLHHHEVAMSLHALSEASEVLVSDLGSEERAHRVLLDGFDTVVVVASGDPIGIARLIQARDRLESVVEKVSVLVVVNKVPGGRFHRGEIRSEVTPALGGIPFVTVPFDDRVAAAVWEGVSAGRGPFSREVGRIADLVAGSVAR